MRARCVVLALVLVLVLVRGCASEVVTLGRNFTPGELARERSVTYRYVASASGGDVVIELERVKGAPVIFVRPETSSGGWRRASGAYEAPGGGGWADVPLRDGSGWNAGYGQYGFVENHRWIKLVGVNAGSYEVRVQAKSFSNDQNVDQGAKFRIRARSSLSGTTSSPLCAWDCSGPDRGTCEYSGSADGDNTRCQCTETTLAGMPRPFGMACRDSYEEFKGDGYGGSRVTILPGVAYVASYDMWLIYRSAARGVDIYVDWADGDGDPLLLIKAGSAPTLVDYHFSFGSFQRGRTIILTMQSVMPGTRYYLALYNRNIMTSGNATMRMTVASASWINGTANQPSVMSMAFVIFVSLSFCIIVVAVKRFFQRRQLRQFRQQRVQQLSQGESGPGATRRVSGTPEDVIARIPIVKFDDEVRESVVSEGQEPTCSICLDEYINGDELRRLSVCKHMFHRECADLWLRGSHTCPNCRASVLPPATEPAAEAPAMPSPAAARAQMIELSSYPSPYATRVFIVPAGTELAMSTSRTRDDE